MTAREKPGRLSPELETEVEHAMMGLVRSHAKRRHAAGRAVPRDELESIGYMAMVEQAPDYDRARGNFDQFVSTRVRYAMLDHIRKVSTLHKRETPFHLLPSPPPKLTLDEALEATDDTLTAGVVESLDLQVFSSMTAFMSGPRAEDELVDHIVLERFRAAIASFVGTLKEPETSMFRGHYLDGKGVSNLAVELGFAERTLERALQGLRGRLRQYCFDNSVF